MKKNSVALIVLSLFVVLAAYCNNLNNDFLWDDEFLIQKNSFLRDSKSLGTILVTNSTAGFGGKDNFYRPTQILSYWIVFQMFGESKIAFHGLNILFHWLNTLLLAGILLKLFSSWRLAFIAATLWAVHPTHVEAITYMSGTADPLSTFFFLASTWFWIVFLKSYNKTAIFFSLISFVFAQFSKESLIVGPALLHLITGFYTYQKMRPWKIHGFLAGHWFVALTYLVSRKTWLNFDNTFQFYKTSNLYTENILYRLYTHLATLPSYIKILIWPTDLHMEREFPVYTSPLSLPVFIGGALMLFAALLCWKQLTSKKWVWPLALFWYVVAFIPMNGILLPVNSFMLEHWLYLPSLFLFAGLASLILKTPGRYTPYIIYGLILIGLTLSTRARNTVWSDPITFYSDILKYTQGSARVHNNIAMAYSEKRQIENAEKHYKMAIETADMYPQTHYNLARLYIEKENYQEAQKHLLRSLEIAPDFIYAQKLLSDLNQHLNNLK